MGKPVIVAASRKVDLPQLGNAPPTILETGIQVIFTYDVANKLLTSLAGTAVTTYSYDANGNLAGVSELAGLTTMSYDKENRLSVHLNGGVTTYSYSGGGKKRTEAVFRLRQNQFGASKFVY